MKKYSSYKDSGIEWIGEIPSEWDFLKVRHTFFLKGRIGWQGLKADEFIDKGPYLVTGTDFQNGQVNWDTCYHISEERYNEAPEIHVQNGDVLITKDGTVGKMAFIENKPEKVSLNSHLLIVRPLLSSINNKYVYWAFQTSSFDYYKGLSQTGSIMESLSQEKIASFIMPYPSLQEQTAIANYLDSKCSKIDNVIATQEKRVELLRELKQSIITRAVTRGINPDVKMKDSGVEWIGEVPEHWEVMKLNNVCHTITDFVASGSFADLRNNVQYLDEPDYAMLVRTADLSQKNRDVAKVYVSKDSYDFLRNSNLYGGEIVLPNIGASIGDAYVVPEDMYEKMTLGPNSILLRTNYNDMFFYYYFCSKSGRESLILMGQAAAQSKFNKTELRQMKVVVPPIEEQEGIVKFIERRTSRLDKSIDKALRQIELLKEYKQSLITEVVTGKRKVI